MLGGASLKNLFVMVLLLTVGLSLAPFLVGLVMDALAVTIYSATGWDLSVNFMQNTLEVWPGGEVIGALMFDQDVTMRGLLLGTLQVLMVVFLRHFVPPIVGGNGDFRVGKLLWVALLDAGITCLIAIGVGWLFTLGMDEMFDGFLGGLLGGIVGLGTLGIIVVAAFVALGRRRGNAGFAFGVMTAVGRFALVTFALITWSFHNVVGALTVAACIIACGVLALVDGRAERRW